MWPFNVNSFIYWQEVQFKGLNEKARQESRNLLNCVNLTDYINCTACLKNCNCYEYFLGLMLSRGISFGNQQPTNYTGSRKPSSSIFLMWLRAIKMVFLFSFFLPCYLIFMFYHIRKIKFKSKHLDGKTALQVTMGGVGTVWSSRPFATQAIQWFYDSLIL